MQLTLSTTFSDINIMHWHYHSSKNDILLQDMNYWLQDLSFYNKHASEDGSPEHTWITW